MFFLLVLLLFILALAGFLIALIHLGFKAPRIKEKGNPSDFGLDYHSVSIPAEHEKQLFGWLLPNSASEEIVIILHGWGGNAELMLPIAKPFRNAGFNVLLIDARSHGNSEPDTFSSLPRFAQDLGSAIDWLKIQYPESASKIALLGHSVGAGAVLFEASKRNDIDAVISIAAFAHPEWMMQRYLNGFHLPRFLIRVINRYVEWIIGHRFKSFAPLSTVCKIQCPVLLVHGDCDTTIPIEDAHTILNNCPEPHLSLLEVEDAGHDSVDKIEQHSEALLKFLANAGFRTSA